jgi:type III secretion protein J
VNLMRNQFLKLSKYLLFVSLLMIVSACTSKVVLFNSLTEADANEVYAVLLEAGFPAKKSPTDEGFAIEVPSSMTGDALSLLSSRGLPKDRKGSIGEIFKKEGMISSPLEEKARYLYALSQELEQTLMVMDGVISARVHIVLPERSSPGETLSPSSVAVFVKHEPESSFPAYIGQIRELVVSSIPSLTKTGANENVSIVAIPSASKRSEPLSLTWYGPMALQSDDRLYFLAIVYGLILLWMVSLAAVYMTVSDPSQRPKFINALLKIESEPEVKKES